ncbi:putative mitochondrial protein [Apostasia shenzhenica]|uniref:Putative mitochondrial protein n=1 Tax=Apostasia shenzhenica TaxID=1088818 RepID=A0A2I0AQL8_9ASPA|nr:putative mitochondrial protein [Apostasia shenzhenica]
MHPRRGLEDHTRTDPRVLLQGYYWPNLQKDAKEVSQKCPQCQIYSNIPRQPAAPLHPITSSWPFSMWGLDFLGPFPKSGRNLRHVLLATDYFSKWVEAKVMAQPMSVGIRNFIWTQLICRFGVPLSLICDNGSAFTSRAVQNLCSENGIKLSFASVRHPQSNG